MKRLLPPLVVLVLLGVVIWRVSQDDQRVRDRQRIESRWGLGGDPTALQETLDLIDRYVRRYGHVLEERWFAARSLLKSDLPPAAIDTLWGDPAIRDGDRTGRRLARLMLEVAGFRDDEALEGPSPAAPVATAILMDGGDERALAIMEDTVQDSPWSSYLPLYYMTWLYGREGARKALAAALREAGDAEGDLGAATLAAASTPYPEREADFDRLLETVRTPPTEAGLLRWSLACQALGRMETPEALDALEARRAGFYESDAPLAKGHAGMASMGLVAGGRWDAISSIEPFLDPAAPDPAFLDAFLQVALHRFRRGDPEAVDWIQRLWRENAVAGPLAVRPRLALGLFLRDQLPDPEGPLSDLERQVLEGGEDPADGMLSAALRLRRGKPGARDELVAALRTLSTGRSPSQDLGFGNPVLFSPLVQCLRALYLYDR